MCPGSAASRCRRSKVTAELDAVPERCRPGDGLQPVGQPLDGKERAREEEDGEEEEAEDGGQRGMVSTPPASAAIGAAKASPQSTAANEGCRQRGEERACDGRHASEEGSRSEDPRRSPGEQTAEQLVHTNRRGDDRVVSLRPADARGDRKLPSFVPICMARAAISPGATNSR